MKLKSSDLTDRIIGQKKPTASTVPPVAETMMFPIAIDQIDEYEGNPRLYENPEFPCNQGFNSGTRCDPANRGYETPTAIGSF